MIVKDDIKTLVERLLSGSDYELQRLEIDSENNILVEIDRLGIVDVDFCAELNRKIVDALGDKDDYSLEVGSVSLTDPFISKLQYIKHVGDEVEVLADGKKLRGQLISADDDTFAIEIEVMVLPEGKKRKVKELQTLTFRYDEVTYTKYNLKF
ncbi:MAG: ribosome assembly cofactor RimP [Paludibacteraceae bacterium]|jgi:ribosome maturation factor RimP|nr:ribosome assembly cofactor RimP [Paludibacteraceae bacterium]